MSPLSLSEASKMPTISGYVDRIVYYNEENGFAVAKFQEKGKRELTTIVGNLAGLSPGESLHLTGKWVKNRRFGEQFQVEQFEIVAPATLIGIQKYLGSGLIKGIGPVLAERMIEKFGLKTIEVIEKTPERLSEVDGIGPKRVEMILAAWQEQKEVKEIMIFLQGHGVSVTYSTKIYKRYGKHSIDVLKENPYCLAREIQGIGFTTADRIARSLGIDAHSPVRVKAGLLHVLTEVTHEGHVFYPEKVLIRKTGEVLKVDAEVVRKALEELQKEREVVLEELGGNENERRVYLRPFHVAEVGIAERMKRLLTASSIVRSINTDSAMKWAQEKLGIQLAQEQRRAIDLAARDKILIITGGPGTGKTTIILAVVRIFQQLGYTVLLAAPTGRAAKRMAEATGQEAKTIHRLLEYSPKEDRFKKNEEDPLRGDIVIIDEASMVDNLLMYHLLKAIPDHAHLILVGDVDQLPSVGSGNVLRDMINSEVFTVVRLSEIFRQAQESAIVVNAHRVNQGKFPVLKGDFPNPSVDFHFLEEGEPERALERILSLCGEEIPRHFGLDPVRDVQVITPMHRGTIGVATLNTELQRRLNPNSDSITLGSRVLKVGDKVMQMTNNYEKEVFNGDIGWIAKIDHEEQEVTIDFDGRWVRYDYSDLDEVALAYAISVHKSQGSEYPAIIMPVSTQHYILLQRNLIYTAITRARRLVVLIGTQKALAIAIRNNRQQRRYTHLCERLKKAQAPTSEK